MDKTNSFNDRFKLPLYKLAVSYDQKDRAKELGARWSPEDKFWFLSADSEPSRIDLAKSLGFRPKKDFKWNDDLITFEVSRLFCTPKIGPAQKGFVVEAICCGFGFSPPTKASRVFIAQYYRCPWCDKSKGDLLSWSSAKQRWSFACYLHNYSEIAVCSKCQHEIKSLIRSKRIGESGNLSLFDLKKIMAK